MTNTFRVITRGTVAAACAVAALVVGYAAQQQPRPDETPNLEWQTYRGSPGGTQHVELAQINTSNVHRLKVAWEYRTGDSPATPGGRGGNMYSNPLIVDGVLYSMTPVSSAVAVDARTGREIWRFESSKYNEGNAVVTLRNRGVAYWRGPSGGRIFVFVKDRVYAVNAKTGELIRTFGADGHIDLRQNLGGFDPAKAWIEMTTPGSVYENFLIVGSRVNEDFAASPGHIRAYDTETGAFKWIFHTIPKPGEFGHDTWEWVPGENYGGANAWGGVTIDAKRGWAFVATGSPTEDFYGGMRKGTNLFGNSVIALDAKTGKRIWHYQTIHHDLWDYDNPSAPILVTLQTENGPRDVVVQMTKMGFIFVLDRETGQPIHPTPETPVPASTVPGERAYPTQPIPSRPAPLVRQRVTEADLTDISSESRAAALELFRRYDAGPVFTPPSQRGIIMSPGWLGGIQWAGAAFDPLTNVLYINANDAPSIHSVRPIYQVGGGRGMSAPGVAPTELGRRVYQSTCVACHRLDRAGLPPMIPSLGGLQERLPAAEIERVIGQGRNAMPGFAFRPDEMAGLLAYLKTAPPTAESATAMSTSAGQRYASGGTRGFVDHEGYPAVKPPWGTLNAVNLLSGDIVWKVPLGEYPELVAKGIRNTGTTNFGGPVATSGGLVFIAATADEKIRAFEKQTGRVLWEYKLPFGGHAVPSVYMLDGRQYLVIVAGGGGRNGTKSGDAIVAFTLPDEEQSAQQTPNTPQAGNDGWISLFDGKTLNGWAELNGYHKFSVEDGEIVARTVPGSPNSFLVSLQEFSDFEMEVDTTVDKITNQGIQFRSRARPATLSQPMGRGGYDHLAGRVTGPQVEVRRYYKGQPTTGILYGEAMGTGWLSSPEKIAQGHQHFHDDGWNKVRIVAVGPRIQSWVNGHLIEDMVNEAVYKSHPKGFIGLQVHGLSGREEGFAEAGLSANVPLVMKWKNIRIRRLPPNAPFSRVSQ